MPGPGHHQARSCLASGPRPGFPRVKLKGLLQFQTKHVASASKPKSCLGFRPKTSSRLQNQRCSLRSKNLHCCLRCNIPPNCALGPELGLRPRLWPPCPHFWGYCARWDLWALKGLWPQGHPELCRSSATLRESCLMMKYMFSCLAHCHAA